MCRDKGRNGQAFGLVWSDRNSGVLLEPLSFGERSSFDLSTIIFSGRLGPATTLGNFGKGETEKIALDDQRSGARLVFIS